QACRGCSGDPAEDACEVTLIGEAAFGGDGCQGPFRVRQKAASGLHPQALLILSWRLAFEPAKRACQVDGMHSGVFGQAADLQAVITIFMQTILRAAEPARRLSVRDFVRRYRSDHLEHTGLKYQRIGRSRFKCGVKAKPRPKDRARAAVDRAAIRKS